MDPSGKKHMYKTRVTVRVYQDIWLFEKYMKIGDIKQGGAVISANKNV